jgi:hypothetical protein
LSNLFGYIQDIHTCHSKLRYFDWDGQVHLEKDKTGGQEGDPSEMLIFKEDRAVVYVDDGYINAKLSVVSRSIGLDY